MTDHPPKVKQYDDYPPRMKTAEVCEVARYGRMKLAAEIKAGRMPEPISPGRPNIYSREAVFKALGLIDFVPARNPWDMDPEAIREALAKAAKEKKRRR